MGDFIIVYLDQLSMIDRFIIVCLVYGHYQLNGLFGKIGINNDILPSHNNVSIDRATNKVDLYLIIL